MKNSRKILLLVLMLALAVCALAITAFAADEATSGEGGSTVAPAYQSYEFPADKPAADYPLAVFKDNGDGTYTFVNVYKVWKDSNGANSAIDAALTTGNAVIYLRGNVDFTQDISAFVSGKQATIVVDLNDQTFTAYKKYILEANCDNTKTNVSVTFKNGYMTQSDYSDQWRGFVQYSYKDAFTSEAQIDYTFENVTFTDDRDNTGTTNDFIVSLGAGKDVVGAVNGNITFNGCTFKLNAFSASANSTRPLFYADDTCGKVNLTYKVNGGKIESTVALTVDKLMQLDADGDSITFDEYNGSYTQFVYPTASAPTGSIIVKNSAGVELMLSNPTIDGDNTVYELAPITDVEGVEDGIETTPYGTITGLASNETATAYPLAVFKKLGNYYVALDVYNNWYAAATAARFDGAVIYFRDNVTRSIGEVGVDLDGVKGSITIDLNDKIFTKADKLIYDIYLRGTTTNVTVLIKNGTMVQQECKDDWRAFIQYNYGSAHTVNDAVINFTFDTVIIKDNRTSLTKDDCFIIVAGGGADGAKKTTGKVVYNNCEIYSTSLKRSDGGDVYIFNGQDTRNKINIEYVVNGGKIVSDTDITMSKLIRVNSGSDSVTFGNYNGQYTEFVYPNSVTISNDIAVTDDFGNTRVLAKKSNDDTNTTYELAEKTPYGLLTGLTTAQTADKAQLVLFEDKGNNTYTRIALYSGADWDDAFIAAYGKTKAVIYFRADITPRGDNKLDNNVYINDKTTTVTVDMNGKTLYKKGEAYLIQMLNKDKAVTNVNVTFKNGTMVHTCTSGRAWRGFFQFAAETTHTQQDAKAIYTFDNVNFIDQRTKSYNGSAGNDFIFSIAGQTAVDGMKDTNITIDFNNCELSPAKDVKYIFNFNNNSKLNVALTMNGGKIVSSIDLTKTTIFNGNAGSDTIAFGQGTDGYTIVELASGKTIDTATVWNTADGAECVFVNVPETTTYKLYPTVMQGYNIKTSVTLYSNFVYNVYIPVANVESFVVGGVEAKKEALATWPVKTVNGVECYCVSVELPVAESLGDIAVTVALRSGTTTVDANWTLNVINYAEFVLADTKTDDVTTAAKALVKDMLVYADAAHTLFEEGYAATAKATAVKELITANASNTVIPNGTVQNASNTYFSKVEISLNDVPSFRFYLNGTYAADQFTFKVGGKAVDAAVVCDEEDNPLYLEITMYAYMMLDDVTYTVVGTETSESYNLYAYYAYVSGLLAETPDSVEYANIKAVVEGLMKYSVSAKAYKAAVEAAPAV